MIRPILPCARTGALALAAFLAFAPAAEAKLDIVKCEKGAALAPGDGTDDLLVTGPCKVGAGTFLWKNVNIVTGGTLEFADEPIVFNAAAIVIENGGALVAGTPTAPIGTKPGGKLTIKLWGRDQGTSGGKGVRCALARCGIPEDEWTNGRTRKAKLAGSPDSAADYFYPYEPLPVDDGDMEAYFGYKVLALSYGGTLQLYGSKGATYGAVPESSSGKSWVRLAATLDPAGCDAGKNECTVMLDREVDWAANDQIVVTTTDYLPGHSEQFTIKSVAPDKRSVVVNGVAKWKHNGEAYPLSLPARLGIAKTAAETRAAVALLSRSIRIVSGGETAGSEFPAEPAWSEAAPSVPANYFGGHTIVRQGFRKFQVQGVEFFQLGQGGRAAHYPVHFHLARKTPPDTYLRDSSIHDSMTRWAVLHGTHGVNLERNVGYKSIGHGYYLEEGTEVDNRLIANIGIFARAAIDNAQNPRKVPGILAAKTAKNLSSADPEAYRTEFVPFYSDYDHPAVFWIMNGWNEFAYNMAAGAGACGVCYWLLPGANSGHSRHQTWEGYASLQSDASPDKSQPWDRAGLSPLKRFVGNFCTTAATSFNTVGNTSACTGIGADNVTNPDRPLVKSIENPLAPPVCDQANPRRLPPNQNEYEPYACVKNMASDHYYPKVSGGGRFPTRCDTPEGNCGAGAVNPCNSGDTSRCMVTVIEDYTSSFHWTETNFAAIWLRPHWYLYSNSVLTDVINAGLTFVTGGGYTASDIVTGHWALAWRNVFIGETQAGNPYASIGSPVNPSGLACDGPSGNHCLVGREGVSFPKGNFGMNQRMFNIYDGPAQQDSNAYLNIRKTTLDCTPGQTTGSLSNCGGSKYLLGPNLGVPRAGNTCYLPHAAIGWKQPNGFYYPPAFHSANLHFDGVDIRHFVTQPLFEYGTYKTDATAAWNRYCNFTVDMFNNWTDIDRQTELNDDDGSLTGYAETISVNEDPFFNGPKEGIECLSDETVKTSPYDFVTAVVYPDCLLAGKVCPNVHPAWAQDPNALVPSWARDCGGPHCYGVPLYRQLETGSERRTPPANAPVVHMAGQGTGQRSTLLANNGTYYIDTTVSEARQTAPSPIQRSSLNVFQAGGTYYTFLVFAKPTTKQTWQVYVGPGFTLATDAWPVRVDIRPNPPVFTPPTLPVDQKWPAGWSATLKGDVLEVTMDMNLDAFRTPWVAAQKRACGPASFCEPSATECVCAVDPVTKQKKDPLCHDAVCSWAGNDADCPEGGCWGFGFRMGKDFKTDPVANPRPPRQCFDATKGWGVAWKPASEALAGACYNAAKKADDFCTP